MNDSCAIVSWFLLRSSGIAAATIEQFIHLCRPDFVSEKAGSPLARGLKPHRVTRFKVSRDPQFVEKLEDIVGLYMSPPEHALVLYCDEKSQVQALDRTQPGLPMKPGRAATMTHDYKRNGTTTLFAAMNTLDGTLIARCEQRHRHIEWLD